MMLIVDGNRQPKVLLPVPKFEWREPSRALPKDQFGRQNTVAFKLAGYLRGQLIDYQTFTDRDEFDYALWRNVIQEPFADVVWKFATTISLSSSAGSTQTWTRPADFNPTDNAIHCLAAGGAGAHHAAGGARKATGGGGGAWSRIDDYNAPSSLDYQIGAGEAAATSTSIVEDVGAAGGDTWFSGTSLASAACSAEGGRGGIANPSGTSTTGVLGGLAANGIGDAKYSGGSAGSMTSTSGRLASGGGGAAGPSGDGASGASSSTTSITGLAGGNGDNGLGGAGSAGRNTAGTTSNGGDGTEILDGLGSGGGSGGAASSTATVIGSGNAGNYGGGSGAAQNGGGANCTRGASAQGIILIEYVPFLVGSMLMMF